VSIDRNYTIRVHTVAENSGARKTARVLKRNANTSGQNADDGLKDFEAHGRELLDLVHELNAVLLSTSLLLRDTFDPKIPDTVGISSAIERINPAGPSEQPSNQAGVRLLEQIPATASDQAVTEARGDLDNVTRKYPDSSTMITQPRAQQSREPGIDDRTHAEMSYQIQRIQKEFQTQGPSGSDRDVLESLSAIPRLSQALFDQSQNTVTKQQFQQELAALRRLIESKGK
jgi:hypothetical protein